MLKLSIHICHWFFPRWKIAMLHQKAGECNQWTKSNANQPFLFASKPYALICEMGREIIASIILIPLSPIVISFSVEGGILKFSKEKEFCVFPVKTWKDSEQILARNFFKLYHKLSPPFPTTIWEDELEPNVPKMLIGLWQVVIDCLMSWVSRPTERDSCRAEESWWPVILSFSMWTCESTWEGAELKLAPFCRFWKQSCLPFAYWSQRSKTFVLKFCFMSELL